MRTPAAIALLVMLAGPALMDAGTPAAADGVHVRLQSPSHPVFPNDEFDVEFVVDPADEPFNGFDVSFRFDPAMVSYVTGSNVQGAVMTSACPNRFHIFQPAPDSLRATLVLLCANTTVTGPGTLYRVRFKAGPNPGTTFIRLGPFTQFYNAGPAVTPLDKQDLPVCIFPCTPTGVGDPPAPAAFAMLAPRPNPWSGASAASFAFDLPAAGEVTLTLHDLAGRVVATSGPAWLPGGRQSLELARPRVSAGMYFARVRTPFGTASRPVVLTR